MSETGRKGREACLGRKTPLQEQGEDRDLEDTTAAERLGMMWQLNLDAGDFTGDPVAESPPPRHIV